MVDANGNELLAGLVVCNDFESLACIHVDDTQAVMMFADNKLIKFNQSEIFAANLIQCISNHKGIIKNGR